VDITVDQFEFMGAVPVKAEPEEGSAEWGRRYMEHFVELSKEHGGLFTRAQAARFLKVEPQAIADLAARGKIRVIDLEHGVFYSGKDILARMDGVKGKPGRPKLRDALDLQKPFK
jgi:hypothetical protein